jgi:hypothetical protein
VARGDPFLVRVVRLSDKERRAMEFKIPGNPPLVLPMGSARPKNLLYRSAILIL